MIQHPYTCPFCGETYSSSEQFKNHNAGKCFDMFGKREIETTMKAQRVSESSRKAFSSIMTNDGVMPPPDGVESTAENEHLSEMISKGEVYSEDQLKGMLTPKELKFFEDHFDELCEKEVLAYIPWYLVGALTLHPDEMHLDHEIAVQNASPVVNKCIDELIYCYVTLCRMYITENIFNSFSLEIDQWIRQLSPSLFATRPSPTDDLMGAVVAVLSSQGYITSPSQFTSMVRNDILCIKNNIQAIGYILSHFHTFYSSVTLVRKKLEFYYSYTHSPLYAQRAALLV